MKILFKIFAQASHHNATFAMARALLSSGHEVVYAVPPFLQRYVENQGFSVVVHKPDFIPESTVNDLDNPPDILTRLKLTIAFQLSENRMLALMLQGKAFDSLIRLVKPSVVFVDSPYAPFAISLFKANLPFAILETTVALHRSEGVPPPSSRHVPSGSRMSNLLCRWQWATYFFVRRLKAFVGVNRIFHPKTINAAARASGVSSDVIFLEKYLQLGISSVPEFILSPRRFDFRRTLLKFQRYVDLPVEVDRIESGYDACFTQEFKVAIEKRKRGRPLVFCALGTAAWRYKGIRNFYCRISAASEGQEWTLVLALPDVDRSILGKIPENVLCFDRVPQLEVLKNSDLMVHHGGMNSISECIAIGVPMLAFPGTAELDQCGNAARIEYHKLGRMGHLTRSSVSDIRQLIRSCLTSSEFRNNVGLMKTEYADRSHKEHALEELESYLLDIKHGTNTSGYSYGHR